MKAARTHGRGGPEQIVFEETPLPEVRRGDVLVQVRATGITPAELTWDETYRNADGTPRIPGIPGHEVSGIVQGMAADVTDFRIGDEVYGLADFPRDGAAAEFAAVRAINVALKPRSISHLEAAALPLSALTAWQAFFEHAQLAAGQSVLIHAAPVGSGPWQCNWHVGEARAWLPRRLRAMRHSCIASEPRLSLTTTLRRSRIRCEKSMWCWTPSAVKLGAVPGACFGKEASW